MGHRRDRKASATRTTMNETIFLGGCPVIRPEGIYLDGQRVIRLGIGDVGVGDVGDLLAYRQMWEPFIAAHLKLWRDLNALLEGVPEAKKCPDGIFDMDQVQSTSVPTREFCQSLALSRMRVSATHPLGILKQWNTWSGKSSSEITAGAASMLRWHQGVVMSVGGPYKDELVKITQLWKLPLQLPDLPPFSLQDEIRARIEGAYIATKGTLQLIGYGVGETLKMAGEVGEAVAQGLSDTAKQLPQTTRWIGIAAVVTAVVVGGALIVYYLPRKKQEERYLPARRPA
jgi:hypothetical protein